MKNKIFALGLVCLLVIFLVNCKKGTPTTPEPPKPTATYNGTLYVEGRYSTTWWLYSIFWNYDIWNTNGIGATVQKVEHELLYKGESMGVENWYPAGTARVEANAGYKWYFENLLLPYPGFWPAKAKVKVYLRDDNAHDVVLTGGPINIYWIHVD